ncbi:MAG: hypothetical protein EOP48_33965 [Sphingobacteriales bacterium]|nr:MAG: hypothetical protein EOP48_33965 [Sphingobacteriales bacterium]
MKMENIDFDPKIPGKEENNSELNELGNSVEEADDEDLDEEDFSTLDKDDDYDNYGRSGEKYGWYNGWSDDVIDDAFEGDPENTWNVD